MTNYQVSQPEKILLVITKSNWGGAQRYVFDLATALKNNGKDTAVIFGRGGILSNRLKEAGIRTLEIPSLGRDISLLEDIRSFFALLSIFKKEKPTIVHLNSSKIGGLGALAARLARVPKIIYTAHGWPFLEDRSAFKTMVIKFLSWITISLSTHVIDVSKKTQELANELPGAKEKTRVVYNGIDPETQFESQKAAREFLAERIERPTDFFKGKVVVGTISELTKNKGLRYTLRAIQKIRHLPFIFIVLGEGEDRGKLESTIKEFGLEEKVFLPGFTPNASHYLPGFDIFTLASIKEGFPYCILEAGLAELPVIATSVGGIPEIVNDTNGILIDPKNSPHIAASLTYLIDNKVAREILGKNLREKVSTHFTKDRMLQETFSVYEK